MKVRSALVLGLSVILLSSGGCAANDGKQSPHLSPTDAGDAGEPDDQPGLGGAPDPGSSGGKGGMGEIDTNPNGDAGGPDQSCAADISKAELVPLDMYIMMDVSGSMLSNTQAYDRDGKPIQKWTAIKTALTSFLEDEKSSGVGVGIQYFPLLKAGAPATCSSDAECGTSAPCILHYCVASGVGCVTQPDCGGSIFNQCATLGHCGTQACPVEEGACRDGSPCVPATTSVCQHTAICDAAAYASPAKGIEALPGSGADLIASIDSQQIDPNSQTPTGPALTGALKQASEWAKAHRNHRVVAVLATDGVPGECSPQSSTGLKEIAAAGLAATPSTPTFVIGVFSSTDIAQGRAIGNAVANAGGTKAAIVIDTSHDVASEFRAALDQIRGTQLACEFEIPEPSADDVIDYALINVNFKMGKKSSTLPYVGSVDDCDPLRGGWYYDTDPTVDDPTRIIVCPVTCATFQAASNASVDIAVGCQTIVK